MDLTERFKHPGAEWRGKPFWSWNGRLEKDELLRQIDVMKQMGFGGFFMHSRTGLETEYLGEEWFELINACADYAESIGLEAWLYDEDRWPSGLAGGIVSQHPEFRQKAILLEIDPAGAGENVVAEFTCDLDGVMCTNVEWIPCDAQGGGKPPLHEKGVGSFLSPNERPGRSLLRFSVIEQGKSGFYNGYTYIDTMNREATEAFLESTHEKYARYCGDRLGHSIKGIFTDEPHRGALLDGFSMYRDDGAYCVPYTPKLFAEFEKRFGYDLKGKLPELFLQLDGRRISPVKWHFTELLQQLFLENFAIPCQTWCTNHGLTLTGHILHEDNLTAQTAMSGSVMRYYEHMAAPGVDVLTEGNRNYWIVKQLTSAARQTGKTQLLSELYGCTGWQMPFAGHKAVGDWQALLGINLRCHHLSWYTMRGEAKRDYPASILHQSAWYREYHHVEDYFSRFGLLMAQGEPVCDVLVINPVESLWAQVHLGWSDTLALQDEHLQSIEEKYRQLFTWMLESQLDFDYGDEEMLSRLASVKGTSLQVGEAAYTTVVVAGMDTIRSSTLSLLEQFATAGGSVIVAGEPPACVDAQPQDVEWDVFRSVSFNKQALLAALPPVGATVEAPDIFGQLRRDGERLIFAALNVDRNERRNGAVVRIRTEHPVEEWDCETGETRPVCSRHEEGWQVFSVDFPAGGSRFFAASPDVEMGIASPETPPMEELPVAGPFAYTLTEPNVCVLDLAEYRFGDKAWEPPTEVLKIDQAIRDKHGVIRRGGEMLQPWFVAQQRVETLCPVELCFHFSIEHMPDALQLVLEDTENVEVAVNGHPLQLDGGTRWIDIAFQAIPVPMDFLQRGENTITLTMTYTENSNIEAIYLLGDFGVVLNGIRRTLTRLPDQLPVGDIGLQGLPFYSAGILYQVPVPENIRRMRLPKIGGACARIDGQVVGWDPFAAEWPEAKDCVEVEVILTRRNTFGPLHDAVKARPFNGPFHWTTDGDEFTEHCMLVPSGLLEPPLIS